VLRLTGSEQGGTRPHPGSLRAGLASVTCLLRGVPLLFSRAPGTPLRLLCIVALDTIHVLRNSQPLPRQRRREVAAFLDFQACANAEWDRKHLNAAEYQALRQRLEAAGLGSWITEYLGRLRELETRRPPVPGDLRRFDDVREYREAVVRLSLATVAAIALNVKCLEEAIRATHSDSDVAALFRMAMQCQIIDDVVDYRQDRSAALPGFLTASSSLRHTVALTGCAARCYQASPGPASSRAVFPFRMALRVLSALATIAVRAAPWLLADPRRD
jgi:hypothetical protein